MVVRIFSNKYDISNLAAEVVAFVVSKENCRKFAGGIITDHDVVQSSEIYLKDRDKRDFMRVKLTLE